MRILVCGSRHFNDYGKLKAVLDDHQGKGFTAIIHGAARGADSMAARYAAERGIGVEAYPADWGKHGKAAGPIRNTRMLQEGKPDYVIAFLAPDSRGTKHMIEISEKAGIPVNIVDISSTDSRMPLGSPRKPVDAFK